MLQTVTQQNLTTTPGQGVPKDSESRNFRPWLKLRLGPKDLDVERQVENWKLEGKATANVTMGIRLVAALEAGNLDAARQICPAIGLLLGAESQRPSRARSPLPDSRDPEIQIPKFEGRKGEIARAISEVTGADLQVNGETLDELSKRLILAGYSAADVYTWHEYVWKTTWPGNKGEWPTLKAVAEGIGRKALPSPVAPAATNLLPGATPQASATPAALPAPAAAAEPEIDEATQARMEAICKVTRKVIGLHRDEVEALAVKLGDYGNFTADDILTWERRCWKTTWPGNKGGPPTLKDLRDRIGEVRELPPEESPDDYYTSDEYLDGMIARRRDDRAAEKPKPDLGYAGNAWLAVKGQLSIQLNKSTYQTWIESLEVVRVEKLADVHRFFVTAPHAGVKDYVDRHIKRSMTRTLNAIYSENPLHPQPPAEIVIEIEGSG